MSNSASTFLEHFSAPRDQFHLHVPGETPYEEMVRKYEASDPQMLHVMDIPLEMPFSAPTAKMTLELWKQHAADERNSLRNTVRVRHKLKRGGSKKPQAFENMVGDASIDLITLYQHIRSAELYTDESNANNGRMILPISTMNEELQRVIDWFHGDENDYEESNSEGRLELNGLPPWIHQTVVFAGPDQSAEGFLLACAGPHKGSVFEFDHDILGFRHVATSLAEFLDLLRCAPLTVSKWVGMHGATAYEHTV